MAYAVSGDDADEVTVPKAIVDLVKEDYKSKFSIVGSVVNGDFLDASQSKQLASVPSFNDSMAMVAGSLNALTAKIARTVNELPSGIARGVQEVSKQKA